MTLAKLKRKINEIVCGTKAFKGRIPGDGTWRDQGPPEREAELNTWGNCYLYSNQKFCGKSELEFLAIEYV